MIESLAGDFGCEVAGVIDPQHAQGADGPESPRWNGVDVAIDFSTPDSVVKNVPVLAGRGISVVIGTTGWQNDEAAIRRAVADTSVGIVSAANFSTGVILFEALVARAAALFSGHPEFGAWLNEVHHHTKKDAPSGTANTLEKAAARAWGRDIPITSVRTGSVPGTHEIVFDAPFEQIHLEHIARDRKVFAEGALVAAAWLIGRRGVFTMRDVVATPANHSSS